HADIPDEVAAQAFKKTADGKNKSAGRTAMRHLFEMYISSGENWLRSSLVLNCRSSSKNTRFGKYVWKTYADLVALHGEDDTNWTLLRVFDSSYETVEGEESRDLTFNTEANMGSGGTANMV
ncbi:unnamed protein product, partial [Effrenium voratum]